MAPRPFAERPKSPLVKTNPVPANDNATVLGSWENGQFRFASPEAREKWRRKSYEQGVGEETWALGKEIDPQSAGLMTAGFGGAASGIYRAPDGTYRQMNTKTIESQAARDHRNRYLASKTMDQIANANGMPGVDEWVAQWKAAQGTANDNVDDAKSAPAAVSTASPQTEPPKTSVRTDTGAGRTIGGRFAAMQEAQKSADVQGAKDITRIATNSILGNYGDEVRAGFGAAGAFLEGKSFGDAYDSNLLEEKSESAAAQERQGLTGTGVELLTSFIPIVGDASGALADFKDWKEHGDEWGWSDYGLVALGVVPGMPNRKAAKGAMKIGEGLLETAGEAGDEIADLGKKSPDIKRVEKAGLIDPRLALEEAKKKVYSPRDARNLNTENRGLIYVQSNLQGSERAQAHQSGGIGTFSDIESKKFADPALRFDNPNPRGLSYIRFDNAYVPEGQSYTMLVDSKTKLAIWSKKTQNKTLRTLERAKQAILQNPNYKLMYEFDTEEAAEEARIFIRDNKYSAYVQVGVRKS